MAITVTRWHREQRMSKEQIVRFQVMVYCYMEGIRITEGDLECMVTLGLDGKTPLSVFCKKVSNTGLFSSKESARNKIDDLTEREMVIKEGNNRKIISLAPKMGIQNSGNILMDIKCLYRE